MKTIGKILLFIGGLLFFVSAILEIISLVTVLVKSPASFFGSVAAIIAFTIAVLYVILDLCGGWSGMTYALANKNLNWVRILCVVIVVFFVLGILSAVITEIGSKTFAWNDWKTVVYGGVSGLLYILGYVLDKKK